MTTERHQMVKAALDELVTDGVLFDYRQHLYLNGVVQWTLTEQETMNRRTLSTSEVEVFIAGVLAALESKRVES